MTEAQVATPASPLVPLRPVAEAERVAAIDVLRGLAILGILLFNIGDFSFPSDHGKILLERFPDLLDHAVAWGTRFFVEGKFYSLFSFLFGVGVAIQFDRARARGERFGPWYRRRLGVLLGIGLIHDLLIWQGMILICYAVVGALMLLFVNRTTGTIVRWVIGLLIVPLLVMAIVFAVLAPGTRHAEEDPTPVDAVSERMQACEAEIAVFATGSYADQVWHRVTSLGDTVVAILALGWYVLAMFLLGLLAWRLGLLTNPEPAGPWLRRACGWGLAVGAVSTGAYLAVRASVDGPPPAAVFLGATFANQLGNLALCLGYVASVLLVMRTSGGRRVLAGFAPVGRTALSNYLLQSLVGTAIFYSWGLGLYGRVGPALNLLLAGTLFAVQLVISAWWVRRFRFGPAEWLWRSLTYGRRLPMRRLSVP